MKRIATASAATVCFVLLLVTVAGAAWNKTATGNAAGKAASLTAPAGTAAVLSSSSIRVSWTAPASGAQLASTYVVRRITAPAITVCTILQPETTTSCDDTTLSASTLYNYTIEATLGSWTSGQSSEFSATTQADVVAPTVISGTLAGTSPTNVSPVSWTVTFSESVTGVDTADFSLTNTGLSGPPALTGVSGSGSTYTVSASTGTGSGTLRLNVVNNGTIKDLANNTLSGATFNGSTYTIDRVAPTVTVNQKSGQNDPTNAVPMLWTVTFSESVTGFDATDLTRSGTSTGGTVAVTGSGAGYEISVSGTPTSGTIAFAIAASKTTDLAGNANTASTTTDDTVTYDAIAPTVTAVTLANVGTLGRANADDTITFTFSEAIDAATFCSTWTNGATQSLSGNGDQTATINENGANDTFTLTTTCAGGFALGSVSLGGDYVAASTNFNGNGANATVITWDPVARTLTIKLGTGNGSRTGVVAGTPAYTPASGLRDLAGNALSTATFTGGSSRF
jgi:hypothetical protein